MATHADTISVYHTLDGPSRWARWSMHFKYACGGVTFRFVVHDAGAHSREAWAALVAGKGRVGRVMEHGGDALAFIVTSRSDAWGDDGDAESVVTIPLAVVAGPLRAAIQAADAAECAFVIAEPLQSQIQQALNEGLLAPPAE
jgi:hypothetical protein